MLNDVLLVFRIYRFAIVLLEAFCVHVLRVLYIAINKKAVATIMYMHCQVQCIIYTKNTIVRQKSLLFDDQEY